MLVLGDARVGHGCLTIIHYRTALIIALEGEALEIERPITEPAISIVEIAIEWTAIEDMGIVACLDAMKSRPQMQRDSRMVENAFHHCGIAVLRMP